MGSWGTRIFDNDHAMDIVSIEVDRWAEELRSTLSNPRTSWDGIDGLLVQVYLLATVGGVAPDALALTDGAEPASSKAVAAAWKQRYLDLFERQPEVKPGRNAARRAVIEETFDALIDVAPDDDAPVARKVAKQPARKSSAKKPAKK